MVTATMPSARPSLSRSSSSTSTSSRPRSKASSLSLDLSDLPPLVTPSPLTNTLLITGLTNQTIFHPNTLAHLEELISNHSAFGIYAFCPLRSLRRIIVTFPDVQSATAIRSILDGETILTDRVRVYFGEHTPLRNRCDQNRHLRAPMAQKQFFISPPPSPPAGWEMRHEDPPNKEVYATDLATALERLSAAHQGQKRSAAASAAAAAAARKSANAHQRRSSCTIVWSPAEHGQSPDLPAIAVIDTTTAMEDDMDVSGGGRIIAHTSRPPVELMSS